MAGSESKCAGQREKTKMRERRRRSITSKILQGLHKHGGYGLPARADINDVLRALAAEAGWVVEPDGTTYRATAAGPPKASPSWAAPVAAQERSSNGDVGGSESSSIDAASWGPPQLLSPVRYLGGGPLLEDLCGGTAVEAWAWAWGGRSSQLNV